MKAGARINECIYMYIYRYRYLTELCGAELFSHQGAGQQIYSICYHLLVPTGPTLGDESKFRAAPVGPFWPDSAACTSHTFTHHDTIVSLRSSEAG